MALRERAARATDAKISRRLLAIALVLEPNFHSDEKNKVGLQRDIGRFEF